MIRPTLNINGSSTDDLIWSRIKALDALADTIEALKQITPHGRDYICDRDRFIADRETHFDRLSALHTLREELKEEVLHLQQQERVAA